MFKPDLVRIAEASGHQAQHAARHGMAGFSDRKIAAYAVANDFIVVTNNALDFRRLYAAESLHEGVIIIIPNVNRAVQQQLFRGALNELSRLGDLVNRALDVTLEGDEVVFRVYGLPA